MPQVWHRPDSFPGCFPAGQMKMRHCKVKGSKHLSLRPNKSTSRYWSGCAPRLSQFSAVSWWSRDVDVVDRLCQLMFYSAYSLQVAALALFLRGFGSTFVSSKAVRSSYHFPGAGPTLKQWEHQNTSIPWSGWSPGDFAPPILQYTGWTGSAQKLPQAPQPSQLVANPEPSFSDLRVLALKIKLIEALEST